MLPGIFRNIQYNNQEAEPKVSLLTRLLLFCYSTAQTYFTTYAYFTTQIGSSLEPRANGLRYSLGQCTDNLAKAVNYRKL